MNKLINRAVIPQLFCGLLLSFDAQAFPCFLTVVKDSCWTKYEVAVTAINANTNQKESLVTVPHDKSWAREPFDCQTSEVFMFQATFSPTIWEGQGGKVYLSRSEKSLPTVIAKGATAWNLTLCYPEDFSDVPLPPEINGSCACDFKAVPPVKPQ